jgi:hypothetical protein
MILNSSQLRKIWSQKEIPVVFRRGKGERLMLRLPYSPNNRELVKGTHRIIPSWNSEYRCWETPRAWFDDLVRRFLREFGSTYVIQAFREEQKCAPACWNAAGFECECSCMGRNHGSGNPNGCWQIVSETFAVEWSERRYACRLLKRRGGTTKSPVKRTVCP